MKTLLKIFIGLIFLSSCRGKEDGERRMQMFVNKYRQSFSNSDLPRFSFDPHVKFESNLSLAEFRIFRRSDSGLMISLRSDRNSLDTMDKIQRFVAHYFDFIEINKESIEKSGIRKPKWLAKKGHQIVLMDDDNKMFNIPTALFDFDPIDYFTGLESLVDSFGILEISRRRNHIQVIFDERNSLLYFPISVTKDTASPLLSKVDGNWYISKEENNVDYY